MSDWAKFFETAGLLYSLWPGLFNWVAGLILPIMAVLVTAAWWMRGYKAETRQATLETEKVALKGQIDLLTQRLALVAEQQKIADAEAKKIQAQFVELKTSDKKDERMAVFDSLPVEKLVDIKFYPASSVQRLIDANSAVSSSLNPEMLKSVDEYVRFLMTKKSEK